MKMCCFGLRVFLLISATFLSFVLHKYEPQIPVVGFYFMLANVISLIIFFLFFKELLPGFVKPAAVHYFSAIGGFVSGLALSLINIKKSRGRFLNIQISITVLWIFIIFFIVLNFNAVAKFFAEF